MSKLLASLLSRVTPAIPFQAFADPDGMVRVVRGTSTPSFCSKGWRSLGVILAADELSAIRKAEAAAGL